MFTIPENCDIIKNTIEFRAVVKKKLGKSPAFRCLKQKNKQQEVIA